MITTNVLLRTDRQNKAGKCPLNIRITKSRKSAYLPTGIKLEPNEWDPKKQRIKKTYKSHVRANALLKSMLADIENVAYVFDMRKTNYTALMVKDAVIGRNDNNDVIAFASRWIQERYNRKEITLSTLKRYEAVIEKVKEYCKGSLPLVNFNADFLVGFELYLQKVKENSTNTIASNFSFLRAVSQALIKADLMQLNDYPFRKWKIRHEESERKYISIAQLKQIELIELPVNSKIAMCRDIFLFCNQTGLRIGDGMRLRLKNYTGTHIQFRRQKGKDLATLPLTDKAKEILDSHIHEYMTKDDYIFDFLSKQNQSDEESALKEHKSATALINKNLGIICKRLKFDFRASTHYARHSMATNALMSGLSMEEVKGILGHKDIKTTQIYAKVHDQMIESAIQKLNSN